MSLKYGEENIGVYLTKSYTDDGLVEKYSAVVKENLKLKQIVADLAKKLSDEEEQSRKRYDELLQSISLISEKILEQKVSNRGIERFEDDLIDKVTQMAKTNTERINDLDLRFQLHENSTTDGHLIWKINRFQSRLTDAITGKVRALHSAPCFTSKYGYKFCLRLYLHGDGMGRGTHLSLFLVIMKSEYDNILDWPFQKKVKFTLINQENRSKDHVEKMFPNKDSSSFQKPKIEMNVASGCPLFIPIERLEKEGFLKDDSLFLDIKIE